MAIDFHSKTNRKHLYRSTSRCRLGRGDTTYRRSDEASAWPISAAAAASIRGRGASSAPARSWASTSPRRWSPPRASRRTASTISPFDRATPRRPACHRPTLDIVFQRALIHHLRSYEPCFAEAHRLLRSRRKTDHPGSNAGRYPGARLAGAPRGYFFERFPRLLAVEIARRPTDAAVRGALQATGFGAIESLHAVGSPQDPWEQEKLARISRLAPDGRSSTNSTTTSSRTLIAYVAARLSDSGPIVEKDRWTLWSGVAR